MGKLAPCRRLRPSLPSFLQSPIPPFRERPLAPPPPPRIPTVLTLFLLATDIGCTNLYTFPNSSSIVDATLPVTFKWDTTCNLGADKIDLYIYSPASTTNSLVKAYQGITFSTGSYTAQLSPLWWNDTTTATLYINILKNGGQTWDTAWPQGPNFNVTYSAEALYSLSTSNGVVYTSTKAGATPTGNTVFESVNATDGKKSNKGVIAAAVVVPILVLIGLAAVAFYFYRIKEKEKLKRWSQALSQHSGMEWEKGALPGDRMSSYGRPSSAYSRSAGRPSTQYGRPSTQYGRPSMNSQRPASSVMMENMAGAGAFRQQFPGAEDGTSRSSVVMADGYVRQSRISFADQPRPRLSAGDQHRPRVHSGLNNDATALAYATGSAIDDRDLTVVSPTQMDGPGQFGDAEIHRASTGTRTGRASVGRREDVKSMLRARGSVDELRDMEAIMCEYSLPPGTTELTTSDAPPNWKHDAYYRCHTP